MKSTLRLKNGCPQLVFLGEHKELGKPPLKNPYRHAPHYLEVHEFIAAKQGDHQKAASLLEDSLKLFEDNDDKNGMALTPGNFAVRAAGNQAYDEAERLFKESLGLYRDLNEPFGMTAMQGNLGRLAFEQEQYQSAARYYAENLRSLKALGDWVSIA